MIGDRDEHELLASARRALSPTAADRERVRRAMAAALGESGPTPAGGATASRPWGWASRIALVGAVAVVSGGLGYRAGFGAGREQASPESRVPVARRSATASSPMTASISSPAMPSVSPAPIPPASDLQTARPAPRRRGVATPSPVAPAASLAEEVRALRAVERALRDGNPGFALALLRELDRAIPDGQLVEERLATHTIARCASGDVPIGVDLGDDFAARYPGSVYGRRVADACAATDSPRSGDSVGRRPTK